MLEISPEPRVKGQLPNLEGGDGKEGNGRQTLESPRSVGLSNYEKALSQGSLRPLM